MESDTTASKAIVMGSLLSVLVGLSFIGLGAGAAFAPQALSKNYGVPASDDSAIAYVKAAGARDAILGALVLWFLAKRSRDALGATIAFATLAAISDFAVVFAARGPAASKNLAIHGGGAIGLIAVWRLVRSGR